MTDKQRVPWLAAAEPDTATAADQLTLNQLQSETLNDTMDRALARLKALDRCCPGMAVKRWLC